MNGRDNTWGKRSLAALACGAALLAAGCGSDKEGKQLPQSSVTDLDTSLNSIERRFRLGDGACQDITQGNDTDVAAVRNKLDALPANVDKDVRDALEESFNHLFDLVRDECKAKTETNTTPTETVPTVTETVPTQTETTHTETTPTQTTTTPAPQKKGKGKGGDNGGGGAAAPGGE